MRKYSSKAGTPLRVGYGVELVEGLRSFPDSTPLAAGFEALNDELDTSNEARRRLRKPMLQARAGLRVKAYQTDKVIRQYSRAVEIADGGTRGSLHADQFPEGLSPVVAPAGRRQIAPTKELIDRLTRSRKPGIEALREEWLPRLQATVGALEGSASAYDAALDAVMNAFKAEVTLRDEHELAVDKLLGEVRALFPRNRATQDAIFPASSSPSRTSADEDEPTEEE